MNAANDLTAEGVAKLVMSNRAIRAADYASPKGLQWGEDVIPALLGLFRAERGSGDEGSDGWVGYGALPDGYQPEYADDWRADTLRVDFHLTFEPGWSDPILVVTAMAGEALGDARGRAPTSEEWKERVKAYQALRSGGDAGGAAAVQAYIAALPGWKRAVASRIDEIFEREVPAVRRAVKWHQPFYGVEGQGWIASCSALSKKLKLTFMSGTSLDPVPPGGKQREGRWLDIEGPDALDEEQLAAWARQAAALPGWGG